MKYEWPVDVVAAALDGPQRSTDEAAVERSLAGLDPSLRDLLLPLYTQADGATLFDRALRLYPASGLVEWNAPAGWKQHQPEKMNDTFYFCSNAFGDQFGVPLDAEGKVRRRRKP